MGKNPHGIRDLHEEATCRRFIEAYNLANNSEVAFSCLQNPPDPDCLCSDGLEIELVSVYYDDEAAKELWSLARGDSKPSTQPRWLANPDEVVFEQIDAAITAKSAKKYEVQDRVWLVIRVDAPLLEWADLEHNYLAHERKLAKGPFEEIWLLLRDGDGDHIARVHV